MDKSAEKLAALQDLWDLYCSTFASKGLDIPASLTAWSQQKKQKLEEYESKSSFDELCKNGCKGLPLVILMTMIQPLRSIEKQWVRVMGTPRQREARIRAIEKAAVVLEDLLDSIGNVPLADNRGSMDTESLQQLPLKLIVLNPAITIQALRTYASILRFAGPRKNTTAASSDILAKYLFSAYVFRATSQFYDSEVSALIGAALGTTYDVSAHKVWRIRNYERLDKQLSGIVDTLADLAELSVT